MAGFNVVVGTSATLLYTLNAYAAIEIVNNGPAGIFISNNSGVDTTHGIPCGPGSVLNIHKAFQMGTSATPQAFYAITATGSSNVTVNPATA